MPSCPSLNRIYQRFKESLNPMERQRTRRAYSGVISVKLPGATSPSAVSLTHAPEPAVITRHPFVRRIAPLMSALMLLLSFSVAAPTSAYAKTSSSDIVCGITAEERGLEAGQLPDIKAKNAIVVGADGTVYFERDADEQVYIASLTKIMTAIVALENADLDDTVVIDHEAAIVGESSANLFEGDRLTLETALRALLLPSGNDAAMAIATTVGAKIDPSSDDPYGVFVDAMNKKAEELGLEALFSNPHGIDIDQWDEEMHASARDVAKMLAYAMQNETFREIDGSGDNTITVTGADGSERSVWFMVWNAILGEGGNIGGKTGTTEKAGMCFAGTFSREGDEIYVVVLGCEEDEERFEDSLTLANWYYDHKATVKLVQSDERTMEGQPLVARATTADWTDKTVDVVASDPDVTAQILDVNGELTLDVKLNEFTGPVEAGDPAGTLTVYQGDVAIGSVDLLAAETIPEPSFFERCLIQFDRFIRWITGQPGAAESEIVATVPKLS